jgi:kynurenine formamidase
MTQMDDIIRKVDNWGRWGKDDQLGTLNYLTPERVAEAAKIVERGLVISLGVPLDHENGPQKTAPRRYNPIHFMDQLPVDMRLPGDVGVADDVMLLPLQATSQWDSLAHVSYRRKIYNGHGEDMVTSHGAQINSILKIAAKVAGRGILADFPGELGIDHLDEGYAITADDLRRNLASRGVEPRSGDILLVRTGFMRYSRSRNWEGYHTDAPGLGMSTLEWLHEHEIAAVATDTASLEVKPFDVEGVGVPFHAIAIVHMGLLLGEIFDFEELAAECAADGRYEFLCVAPPLPVTAGVGSPVNPYVVK